MWMCRQFLETVHERKLIVFPPHTTMPVVYRHILHTLFFCEQLIMICNLNDHGLLRFPFVVKCISDCFFVVKCISDCFFVVKCISDCFFVMKCVSNDSPLKCISSFSLLCISESLLPPPPPPPPAPTTL